MKLLNNNDERKIHESITGFIEEHNWFCTHIWTLNHWVHRIYFVFFLCAFPINLLLMNQLFFESLEPQVRLFGLSLLLSNDLGVFGLEFLFALLSKKIHKTCSKVSRLQWSLNGIQFRIRNKLKLLMCFERLSANQKVGLTLDTSTITFPFFGMVSSNMIQIYFKLIFVSFKDYLEISPIFHIST